MVAAAAVALLVLVGGGTAAAFGTSAGLQPSSGGEGHSVARTTAARDALLSAEDTAWKPAAAVEWGPEKYRTRFRALWSDDGLFVRFDATDPDPWHTMTRRDDRLWDEEVVEIFLDPDGDGRDYYELEVSPANVVCDLRVLTPPPAMKQDFPFDLGGLQTRTVVHRDSAGRATGWTATALLPWAGLARLPVASRVAVPPAAGDRWRFNVFRIERPGGSGAPQKDVAAVAWSPTGKPTFHVPGAFRELVFAAAR